MVDIRGRGRRPQASVAPGRAPTASDRCLGGQGQGHDGPQACWAECGCGIAKHPRQHAGTPARRHTGNASAPTTPGAPRCSARAFVACCGQNTWRSAPQSRTSANGDMRGANPPLRSVSASCSEQRSSYLGRPPRQSETTHAGRFTALSNACLRHCGARQRGAAHICSACGRHAHPTPGRSPRGPWARCAAPCGIATSTPQGPATARVGGGGSRRTGCRPQRWCR